MTLKKLFEKVFEGKKQQCISEEWQNQGLIFLKVKLSEGEGYNFKACLKEEMNLMLWDLFDLCVRYWINTFTTCL